jgi:hypothetical protein
MLKKIPLKKEHLFIIAAIMICLICYRLAFQKTIEAWQIHQQLSRQIATAADLSDQPAYLERKQANLNKIISLYRADTITFRSNIISTISGVAERGGVKLSEVPAQDPSYNTDKFIIQKLSFEGGFFAMTKVLRQLQSTTGIGMVRAFTYRSVGLKSSNDQTKKLILEVYMEIGR